MRILCASSSAFIPILVPRLFSLFLFLAPPSRGHNICIRVARSVARARPRKKETRRRRHSLRPNDFRQNEPQRRLRSSSFSVSGCRFHFWGGPNEVRARANLCLCLCARLCMSEWEPKEPLLGNARSLICLHRGLENKKSFWRRKRSFPYCELGIV